MDTSKSPWHRWRALLTTGLFVLMATGLFGRNLLLRLILPTDYSLLQPVGETCTSRSWPPSTSPAGITIYRYDVGENKLTSVLTGRKEQWVPIKSYVIQRGDQLIVADPGPDRRRIGFGKDWTYNGLINYLVNPIRLTTPDLLTSQMRHRGLDPTHVTQVILNHAHADHTGNLDDFPNAKVIINDVEYTYARGEGARAGDSLAELARAAKLHPVSLAEAPPIATFAHGLDLFDDQTIFLVDLPGHTPGQTGLLVRTDKGSFLLSSDALARAHDLETMTAMPGQHNRQQFLESLHQIDCFRKTIPDAVILPGHDDSVGGEFSPGPN